MRQRSIQAICLAIYFLGCGSQPADSSDASDDAAQSDVGIDANGDASNADLDASTCNAECGADEVCIRDIFCRRSRECNGVCCPHGNSCFQGRCEERLTWQNAVGTDYHFAPEAWLGTTRSRPSPSKLSYFPDVTLLEPQEIDPVVGHFSNELRYYDFEGLVQRDTPNHQIDYRPAIREAMEKGIDLIWNTGQIQHTHTGHKNLVLANDGKYLKDLIYESVVFAHSGEFADKDIQIFFEVGNEINAAKRFSLHDYRASAEDDGFNLLANANDYLQYYLAPIVEAVEAASQDLFGDKKRVPVLLASIGLIRRNDTKAFLAAILNSQVAGPNAPSLMGRSGHEIVDMINLHYSTGVHSVLDEYYDAWVQSGLTSGMWNTEELGKSGLGDFDVLRVSFRWLDYWLQREWSRDSARLLFWGDRAVDTEDNRSDGLHAMTTGFGMEKHLGTFFEDWPLERVAPEQINVSASADMEIYGIERSKRAAFLLLPQEATTLNSVDFGERFANYSLTSWHQTAEEVRQVVQTTPVGHAAQITFPSLPALGPNEAILVFACRDCDN